MRQLNGASQAHHRVSLLVQHLRCRLGGTSAAQPAISRTQPAISRSLTAASTHGCKPSVLIVGASRGIGLGLAKLYAASGWNVHATTRKKQNPGELGQIPNCTLHHCDVTAFDAGESLVASLGASTFLDVMIYNAGINPKQGDADHQNLSKVMHTNAIAPFLVTNHLLGKLQGQKKLAVISSQLGSREKFGDGKIPVPIYHASKCVLNDGFREQEPAWRERFGVTSVIFHPGWVKTDMGGENADITVKESVEGMKAVLDSLTREDTGKFLRWNGTEHPW